MKQILNNNKWHGMVNVDLYSAVITKVSNALYLYFTSKILAIINNAGSCSENCSLGLTYLIQSLKMRVKHQFWFNCFSFFIINISVTLYTKIRAWSI